MYVCAYAYACVCVSACMCVCMFFFFEISHEQFSLEEGTLAEANRTDIVLERKEKVRHGQ